ncbi:hypothetical protein ACWEQL_35495 [Kitasatospora sp. NPDC004240]
MSERPENSVRRWYITGNNVLGNRTLVDLASFSDGRSRERFDALQKAVHGGGCTGFRLSDTGPHLRIEPIPAPAPEAPTVGFRIVSPTGAITSQGGSTWVYLYTAIGDNRILFTTHDDTAHAPTLRTDLVNAQTRRLTTTPAG